VSPELSSTVGILADGQWRGARVDVNNGYLSVAISPPGGELSPVANLQNVLLPNFSGTQPYYFGFAGGSGDLTAQFQVQNVTISSLLGAQGFCY
jgi:hypothetical protein